MAKNYRPLDDPNDHKFMEDFYLQNNRLIMDKVKKYVSNVDDREDIMQIVAESLVKHISTLKELPKDAIALYINYCCKNAAINMGKARTRRNERLTSLNDEDVAWQVEQTFQRRNSFFWRENTFGDSVIRNSQSILTANRIVFG